MYRPGKTPKEKDIKVYGFDVETADNNQRVTLASLYISDSEIYTFTNIIHFKNELLSHPVIHHNAYIAAHNLGFDFFACFKDSELADFKLGFAGTRLMYATTYIEKGNFTLNPEDKKHSHKITFIDTLNYSPLPLKKIGDIIGEKKLDWDFKEKVTKENWEKFKEYNIQDARIARKYFLFLAKSFFTLGANIKLTIAATSEAIFRNKYLANIYEPQSREEMDFIFKGYYGGRTEVFRRGMVYDMNYFDINSLYPSVMADFKYPDPNTSRNMKKGTLWHIMEKEGFSHVKIDVPYMKYPLLPMRHEKSKKVYFTYGVLEGVWTHPELRKAIELGARIIDIGQTIWYDKSCRPFHDFVHDMYSKRLQYQAKKSPMEFVIKIVMNALYGKFGQKYNDKDMVVRVENITPDMLNQFEFHQYGDVFIFKVPSEPRIFCFPCWSAYVTAYGRLRLYEYMSKVEPYMVDTDSIITKNEMPTSNDMGKMKLECRFEEGIIVRPKFYGINPNGCVGKKAQEVKCKGMNAYLSYTGLVNKINENKKDKKDIHIMKSPKIAKFVKFRESLIRHLKVNEVIDIYKEFSLEDQKRKWNDKFSLIGEQASEPHNYNELLDDINKPVKKKMNFFHDDNTNKADNGLNDSDGNPINDIV